MKPLPIAVLLLALLAARVNAQPKAGQVTPDRIALGTVHTGAAVEASFVVYAVPFNDGKSKFEVIAPPFVKVLRTDTRVLTARATFLVGSVEFAIDTTKVGTFTGQIAVKLNATSVQIPVSATIKPQRVGLLRLLILPTPFHKYTIQDGGHLRQWTDLVAGAPWDVHSVLADGNPSVLGDLKLTSFDAVLLGPEEVSRLQPAEVRRIREFAEAGGWVILTANYSRWGTVPKANELLADYGVLMADEDGPDGNGPFTMEKTQIDPQLVKAGVERVTFYRASSVHVTNPLRARVLVKTANVGQASDGFVIAADAGRGRVIVIGQSPWWDWIRSGRDPFGGNAMLLRSVLTDAHRRKLRIASLTQPLSEVQMASCWTALASSDVDEASEAVHWLSRAPGAERQTVPFLRKHLNPEPDVDLNRLNRLITDLDSDSFQTRENAQHELENLGEGATGALKKALEGKPSAEMHHRIEKIMKKPQPFSAEKARELRVIDVLEGLATSDAKAYLKILTKRLPGTRVAIAAQGALERLASGTTAGAKPKTSLDERQ